MKKIFFSIIVFIWIGINIFAQEKSNKELTGDKYYSNYSFDKAVDLYNHAKKLSLEGQRRLAESYHNINQNIESEAAYLKLINIQEGILPDDYYNYAMVLKTNGKYDEANKWMNKFKELKPNDSRVKNYASNNKDLTNLLKDNGKYKIEHLNINTDAEDFGTCYYKNKIVFASSRETSKLIKRKYNWNRKPFLDMYVCEVDGDQLVLPENFDKILNGKMHDGPASFAKDGTYIAFTRNNSGNKSKDGIVKLQIYFSDYKDGKWSKPEPFVFNNEEYSVGHPCLTSDGNTMYFTSNMPGGYGGADIYKIAKDEKGTWGKPENLGAKINTEGDEMFPFFEENNNVLFFTSNGRLGLGGLDIFICVVSGSEYGKVYNAGFPLNTQYDDFAIITDDKLSKGYFSSNRTGGSGDDDIYSFDLLNSLTIEKEIAGTAKDIDGNILSKTFITLLDDKGNIIDTQTTKDDGTFIFNVGYNKVFRLNGEKDNYYEGKSTVNTSGKERIVKVEIILLQKVDTILYKKQEEKIEAPQIKVGADLGKILKLNPIYFNYGKSDIRLDAEIELAKIAKIMNEYPDMIVELGSHTDCRSTKEFNQILSDKRAKASAEFIKNRITKPERIYGKGYGETKLINRCPCEGNVVSDCSEEEHKKNRRTEFIIISN